VLAGLQAAGPHQLEDGPRPESLPGTTGSVSELRVCFRVCIARLVVLADLCDHDYFAVAITFVFVHQLQIGL
jgi:hypothetical protein